MKRGMTAAAYQSLGISDDTKERLNRLVIGVRTMAADSFRNRGSRLSSPAELYGSRFCSSFYPSRIPGPGRLERPARRSVLGSV